MKIENVFLENESRYDLEETITRLTSAIQEAKWGLKHTHDLQEMLKEKSYEVLSANVLEICKPPFAYELLSKDELRIYSNLMPCRVSVYTKQDGKTYVSRMNNGLLSAAIGGVVQEVMTEAYEEVEEILTTVLK